MKTIYKYEMPPPGEVRLVDIPEEAQIVHVDWQGARIYLWALVDPKANHVSVTFSTIGTGWDVKADMVHLGTLIDGGGFVWHVLMEDLQAKEERKLKCLRCEVYHGGQHDGFCAHCRQFMK